MYILHASFLLHYVNPQNVIACNVSHCVHLRNVKAMLYIVDV